MSVTLEENEIQQNRTGLVFLKYTGILSILFFFLLELYLSHFGTFN